MKNHVQIWYESCTVAMQFDSLYNFPMTCTSKILNYQCEFFQQDDAFNSISRATLERELSAKEKEVLTLYMK
jgi:hypothetical protein